MKETFDNRGNESFLVYELQPEDRLEGQSLRALANNKIEGVAPAAFSQVANTRYIRYNVSGKITMNRLLGNGLVSKKQVLGVFAGMIRAMTSIDQNQIDPTTVLLDPDHVFTDPVTGDTVMVCLPVIRPVHPGNTLSALCKFFMQYARLDRREDIAYAGQIQNYLNANPVVSLSEMKAVLEKAAVAATPVAPAPTPAPVPRSAAPAAPMRDVPRSGAYVPQQPPVMNRPAAPAPQPKPTPAGDGSNMSMFQLLQHNKANAGRSPGNYAPAQAAPRQYAQAPAPQNHAQPAAAQSFRPAPAPAAKPPVAPAPKAQAPVSSGMYSRPVAAPPAGNYDETMVLSSDPNATTVLDSGMLTPAEAPAYLIRVKNGEKIVLNKPVFRIGKERSYVDYWVSDNTAVSRAHANIVSRDGEYFVVDTNSTNHTYINGGMIPSNVETRLPHEAKLRLANEDFEFRRY